MLEKCVRILDAQERLSCYDAAARMLIGPPGADDPSLHSAPAQAVLVSELRVNPERSDFSLTLQDFLNLIHNARLEDGSHIQVLGWKQNKQEYTLWLDLHGGTRLLFDHHAKGKSNFSVLAPVNTSGGVIDPELFIMNIAAMSPDGS